jgi:hypothetical protein
MAWQATQEAARGPPSTPGLIRRSGRIPALPYPPIKLLHCTAVAKIAQQKSSTLEENCDKSWGVWGAKPPKGLPPEMRDLRTDSAGDGRRYKKQIAVSPTHVRTFKCLPRKEMFRMLHTYTADAPRISIGTKG